MWMNSQGLGNGPTGTSITVGISVRAKPRRNAASKEIGQALAAKQKDKAEALISEVAALKRNAQSLSSFEPTKSAEMIQDLWKTEKGQDEALRDQQQSREDQPARIQALPNGKCVPPHRIAPGEEMEPLDWSMKCRANAVLLLT